MFSMKIENIEINKTIEKARSQLIADKTISPSLRSTFELLILLLTILVKRMRINSKNSSKPPSQDPNRTRRIRKDKGTKRKPGAQPGHDGSTLEKIDNPDEIEEILIDRRTIPAGEYNQIGFETRQVFDIKVTAKVTEYRAEILEDINGNQFVAKFPEEAITAAQYGNEVKSQSVYMSQFQLIPLARVTDYFKDQINLPLSKGSVSNFNMDAYNRLEYFEAWAKKQLLNAPFNHADETGINISGKRHWLHTLSNSFITQYHADEKRGKQGMDRMGVLPSYKGILCHDHWSPYYQYACVHALCNAHHLRELTFAWEEDNQQWAKKLHDLLIKMNDAIKKSDSGILPENEAAKYEKKYQSILEAGKIECPLAVKKTATRGRQKQSKSRNLLDRLINYQDDTLRFIKEDVVSFTNNQGENDLRMTKVQQKISGCFRSMMGAKIFCRIRGYLVTCRKNGVSPTDALRLLFNGKLPDFVNSE